MLILWLLLLLTVTLFPFDFQATGVTLDRMVEALLPDGLPIPKEFGLNVLLFVPFGALLYARWHRRPIPLSLLASVGAAGLLVSFTVESMQLLLPRRDPTVVDIVANTLGACAGGLAQRLCGTRVDHWIAAARARASFAWVALLITVFTGSALLMTGALQRQARLTGWDPKYPLLVGNEVTGDRPWRGRIFTFEVTDAATPPGAVRSFAAGEPPDLAGRTVARFDFSGSAPYHDSAGQVPSLEWTAPRAGGETGGLRVTGHPWLQTREPAPELAVRIGDTNAFTVRVLCAADGADQYGPARILSNSEDFNGRNFTIGQEGDGLAVRFRTPYTGRNGSQPPIIIPRVFAGTGARDILVTYDGATLLVGIAGFDGVYRTELSPGIILARRVTSLNIGPEDYRVLGVMYLAMLFFVPGVLMGLLGERRGRLAAGLAWVLAFTALLEVTLVLVSGRPFAWSNVAVTAAVGALVVGLVSRTVAVDLRQGATA